MKRWLSIAGATAGMMSGTALAGSPDPAIHAGPVQVSAIDNASSDRITQRVAQAATLGSPGTPNPSPDAFTPMAYVPTPSEPVPIQQQAASSGQCEDGAVPPDDIRKMIEQEAAKQGADVKLALAIADQESGFGASVNSSAGARGPMQLMPGTAAHYGVTDMCNPAENIRGGIAFLKDLNVSFGGNIMLMVAAYNSGEDRVLKSGGIPSISETVNYTARVTNAYYGFNNTLKGGKRAKRNAVATETAHQSSDVNHLPVQSLSDGSPIPSNKPTTERDRQQWIGGSVLYVQ
jgi:Transglycosylase SLT domain